VVLLLNLACFYLSYDFSGHVVLVLNNWLDLFLPCGSGVDLLSMLFVHALWWWC